MKTILTILTICVLIGCLMLVASAPKEKPQNHDGYRIIESYSHPTIQINHTGEPTVARIHVTDKGIITEERQ
jgi:hypothetical protein